jgi:hypothetical protein
MSIIVTKDITALAVETSARQGVIVRGGVMVYKCMDICSILWCTLEKEQITYDIGQITNNKGQGRKEKGLLEDI